MVLKPPPTSWGAGRKTADMQAEGTHVPAIVHIEADIVPTTPHSMVRTKIVHFAKRS
jgi:hypothetical protein